MCGPKDMEDPVVLVGRAINGTAAAVFRRRQRRPTVVHRWDDGALFTALHPFPFSSANVCTLLTKQTMYSATE